MIIPSLVLITVGGGVVYLVKRTSSIRGKESITYENEKVSIDESKINELLDKGQAKIISKI